MGFAPLNPSYITGLMEADPSLLARIAEWFWAVVWNVKGLIAGLSLAVGFLPRLLSEKQRQWLNTTFKLRWPENWRRRVLVGVCACLLVYSMFQTYDNIDTKLR